MSWIGYTAAAAGGVACLWILWQDLKGRWVHLLPLILLFAAGLTWRGDTAGSAMWTDLAINIGFVLVVLLLVWLVLRIRGDGAFINRKLGLGDVLMFVAVTAWLDPAGFMLYYVTGMLLILAGMLLFIFLRRYDRDYPVPLAGLLAGYLLVFAPLYWRFAEEIQAFLAR